MQVGAEIGFLQTLLIAFITAAIGGAVVQQQGLHVLAEIKGSLGQGRLPLGEFFDGVCLIIAGATLITPGFVTDTIGFFLLVPQVRNAIKREIRKRGHFTDNGPATHTSPPQGHAPHMGDVIEGECERLDDSKR